MTAVPVFGKCNLPQGMRERNVEDNRGAQKRRGRRCLLGEKVSSGVIKLGCQEPQRISKKSMPRWRLSLERAGGSKELSNPV